MGGERSETEGGGFAMGHSVARVQRIQAVIGLRPGRPGFGPQSGLVQRGSFICRLRRQENHTTALTGEEMHFPFGGWRFTDKPCGLEG